jgi:demethylmenaquinone methyltransferase/2-methoxy-6-polyprenyl-1,4-benzoquinol methylase
MQKPEAHTIEFFTDVASKYELLNKLMTAGRDRIWRKTMLDTAAAALGKNPDNILDLATGTGDVARMLADRWPDASVIGTDPTRAMLDEAVKNSLQGNITWEEGIAEAIQLPDFSQDLVTIAFGFRNVAEKNREACVKEVARVLRPGGVFAILELGLPQGGPWNKIYRALLQHGMPRFAGLFAPKKPYEYLANSILDFPPPPNVKRMLSNAGLIPFAPRALTTGMCWLYIGKKPAQIQET